MVLTFPRQLPDNITLDQGATIPRALIAGAVAFYREKLTMGGGAALTPFWREGGRGKYANQPILILGGASSLGQYGEPL